jgi:hypothetical protein
VLLAVLKVLAILATAFVAWLLVAGAVLDVLYRRASARRREAIRDDAPAAKREDGTPLHRPPPGAPTSL